MLSKETLREDLSDCRITGAVRGMLTALSITGEALVDYCGNPAGRHLPAIATTSVTPDDIGKEAILLFEDSDPLRPILVGLVATPAPTKTAPKTVEVTVDGKRITLRAENEINLQCGEASITLTREGKVLIKGTYLLSKSTGSNRIKGGSVQLN